MCVYSMVMDHYRYKWPWEQPAAVPQPGHPGTGPSPVPFVLPAPPPSFTPQEVEDFKKDMAEMKKLLGRAKKYDADNGEPDCELGEKKQKLQALADLLGVEIEFP